MKPKWGTVHCCNSVLSVLGNRRVAPKTGTEIVKNTRIISGFSWRKLESESTFFVCKIFLSAHSKTAFALYL
jgi:hypothetical protein